MFWQLDSYPWNYDLPRRSASPAPHGNIGGARPRRWWGTGGFRPCRRVRLSGVANDQKVWSNSFTNMGGLTDMPAWESVNVMLFAIGGHMAELVHDLHRDPTRMSLSGPACLVRRPARVRPGTAGTVDGAELDRRISRRPADHVQAHHKLGGNPAWGRNSTFCTNATPNTWVRTWRPPISGPVVVQPCRSPGPSGGLPGPPVFHLSLAQSKLLPEPGRTGKSVPRTSRTPGLEGGLPSPPTRSRRLRHYRRKDRDGLGSPSLRTCRLPGRSETDLAARQTLAHFSGSAVGSSRAGFAVHVNRPVGIFCVPRQVSRPVPD